MKRSRLPLLTLFVLFTLSTLLTSALAPIPQDTTWQAKVDAWVLETARQGETEFLVSLVEQADLSAAAELPTRQEKGAYVFSTLVATAARSQPPVIAVLQRLGVEYRPLWVVNALWVRGDLAAVQALAQRPEVAHVYANPQVRFVAPQVTQPPAGAAPQGIEWNISLVQAPQVWNQGFTGQGVVIGGADTGYDWDHPALINQYRGWDGSVADHDYNWHDFTAAPSATPIDPYGHGTHTMGTMVGDDGGSNQIGMAPGARWIGCRNMDAGGVGSPYTYISCYQWFIAPTRIDGSDPNPALAPDVISNSWGCPPSEGCTDMSVLLEAVQNVRAAGILTAHSAGNSGSSCSSVDTPGGIYDESFTVGATDSGDNLAGFSSRGPVTVDGSGRAKPDISAPGVNVRSCVPGTGYSSYSGTSMASPHVAGLTALLISAQPTLRGQVDALETLIKRTALHIPATGCSSSGVPNNLYGWGRIDALAALEGLYVDGQVSSPEIQTGGLLTYTLDISLNSGLTETTGLVLTDALPAQTSLVSATLPYTLSGGVIEWSWPTLALSQPISVELVVQVAFTATGTIINDAYGVRSTIGREAGQPLTTTVVAGPAWAFEKTAPAVVPPGGTLTYTLVVTNTSLFDTLHNLVLTDVLPLNTTFLTATQPYSLSGGQVTWSRLTLANGEAWTVELAVQTPLTFTGTISNVEYAVSSDELPVLAGPPVQTQVLGIWVGKTASAEAIAPGDLLTYTLAVTNVHPSSLAHGVILTDLLPLGVEFITATQPYSLSGDALNWPVGELAAGAAFSATLVVRLPLTTTQAEVVNASYGAYAEEVGWVSGAAVQTAVIPYSLLLDKQAPAEVPSGGLLTYTLTVTNPHPFAVAHAVLLSDALPLSTTFITATGSFTLMEGVVYWELGDLGAGEAATLTLVVQVEAGFTGSLSNQEYAAWSDEVLVPVRGAPVATLVTPVIVLQDYFLPIILR